MPRRPQQRRRGKSTTLKLITGAQEPDHGTVEHPGNLRLSLLDQNLADESETSVRDFVALGIANPLVLDEPTNDLDVETLEALKDRLAEDDGTVILVSHDCYFLDSVVTSTLVFEADGQVRRHLLERHGQLAVTDTPASDISENTKTERTKPISRKLSYKLQRELDALPAGIEDLETRVGILRDRGTVGRAGATRD